MQQQSIAKAGKVNIFREMWRSKLAYLFLLPLMIGVIVFCYYPPLMAIYRSFTDWGRNPADPAIHFVGFENYSELFKDHVFLNSIGNMFYMQIPKLIIGIFAPLIMAELLYWVKNKKLSSLYRILILLPIITPGVVNVLIWTYVFQSNGLLNAVLSIFSIESNVSWLNEAPLAIPAIIFMGFPWIGGTSVLIYVSGLMNIPNEIIEAARLDGAKTLKIIRKLHIPSIMGQIRYFLVFGIIGAFQDYGIQVVFSTGQSVQQDILNEVLMVPGFYMYQNAFTVSPTRPAFACAIGTVIFLTVIIITIITFKTFNAAKFNLD